MNHDNYAGPQFIVLTSDAARSVAVGQYIAVADFDAGLRQVGRHSDVLQHFLVGVQRPEFPTPTRALLTGERCLVLSMTRIADLEHDELQQFLVMAAGWSPYVLRWTHGRQTDEMQRRSVMTFPFTIRDCDDPALDLAAYAVNLCPTVYKWIRSRELRSLIAMVMCTDDFFGVRCVVDQ